MNRFAAVLGLALWPALLHAGPTRQILDHYAEAARKEDPGFEGSRPNAGRSSTMKKESSAASVSSPVLPATFPILAK